MTKIVGTNIATPYVALRVSSGSFGYSNGFQGVDSLGVLHWDKCVDGNIGGHGRNLILNSYTPWTIGV